MSIQEHRPSGVIIGILSIAEDFPGRDQKRKAIKVVEELVYLAYMGLYEPGTKQLRKSLINVISSNLLDRMRRLYYYI